MQNINNKLPITYRATIKSSAQVYQRLQKRYKQLRHLYYLFAILVACCVGLLVSTLFETALKLEGYLFVIQAALVTGVVGCCFNVYRCRHLEDHAWAIEQHMHNLGVAIRYVENYRKPSCVLAYLLIKNSHYSVKLLDPFSDLSYA